MLYLVATPLGNLQDITFRALDTLKSCDLILCEDTRHSQKLLDHYQIQKPLKSFHKFNEKAQLDSIITLLEQGKDVALITDAGTPCIQDPGADLVKTCHEKNLPVIAIPGPCAFVMAISLCGEEEGPFQFVGFLPKKDEALKKHLLSILDYEGHSLFYVPPHQLCKTLETLNELDPLRPLFLVRELTKIHEESYQGTPQTLVEHFKAHPPKGEFVLMIKRSLQKETFDHLTLAEHVAYLETTYHLSKKEAIKLAAKQRGVPKRDLYNLLHKN